jgi:Flp pilus assembly protein TadG
MTSRIRDRRSDERGAVAVLVAAGAVVLFGLAALVVDLGHARDVKSQAQNAADASALAAANAMYLTTLEPDIAAAADAAKRTARANMGITEAEWNRCVDSNRPAGYTSIGGPCISMRVVRDSQNRPLSTYVRVRVPSQTVQTPMASLLGVGSVDVPAYAETLAVRFPKSKCGVCILGTNTHTLQNGNLRASDTGIHFNGNVTLGSQGVVSATDLDLSDLNDVKITVEGNAGGSNWSPSPVTRSPRLVDPLAFLTMPFDWSTLPIRNTANPCTNGPGRYGSFSSFGPDCVLSPGLYVITGSWSLTGSDQVTANGSTLYFVCGTPSSPRPCSTSGERGGSLNATGGAGLAVSAPVTGPQQGLSIVYDRNNTSDLVFKGNGGGSSGTIYALRSKFVYTGNGGGAGMDSLIVAGDIGFSGNNATLDTKYSPWLNVPLPPELNLSR